MATRTRSEPRTLCNGDGFKSLPPLRHAALFGFLQAQKELTRAMDAALVAHQGLSLATYEVLNRLAHAERGCLTITELAEATRLSLSRVSRVAHDFERRGLVERADCATDKRVNYIQLTPEGRSLVKAAQETFFTVVEERFLGRLDKAETEQLAEIFTRLSGGGADCATALT